LFHVFLEFEDHQCLIAVPAVTCQRWHRERAERRQEAAEEPRTRRGGFNGSQADNERSIGEG
jgi:hypothetical protein